MKELLGHSLLRKAKEKFDQLHECIRSTHSAEQNLTVASNFRHFTKEQQRFLDVYRSMTSRNPYCLFC